MIDVRRNNLGTAHFQVRSQSGCPSTPGRQTGAGKMTRKSLRGQTSHTPMNWRALTSTFIAAAVALVSAQDIKYEKYMLPNGMTVILHEDHALPVATVNIWYHVGSKDEPPKRSGFAHLFEHLMFMGTKRAPASEFDQIMEAGGGNNNASTTTDRTNYYDFGPSALLPTLLWLEADRLEDLGRMMDQKKLDLQREVVKNERRQNFENTPYGLTSLKIAEAMYPEGHPYRIDTIGLPEDLDAATAQDVKDFFATYYTPGNASMVVAGDFDPKVIKPLISSLFGTLPRVNDPIHKSAAQPVLTEVKRLTLVDRVPQARTYMVWHSPAYYKPGDAEMDLAGAILSDGFASRLYRQLVVADQLASDASAFQSSAYLGSLFYVVATAKEGVSLDKLEAAIDDELAKFVKSGPTADELSRQKKKYEFSALNRLQSLSDLADRLNEYDFFRGEPNSFKWDLERHTKLSAAEVQGWAKKILDPNARLILRVVPQGEKSEVNPRDVKPTLGTDKDFALPTPTELTLANGSKLLYFHRPELPLMSISAMFVAGAASDPAAKAGLASMTTEMLSQGAGNLKADPFNQALDALGANFSASAGQLSTTVDLSVTAANFQPALSLFANSIIRYRTDADAWERQKGLRLDALAQEAEDPESVARAVAMREFFGPSHPYGRSVDGTPATIKGLTLDDLRQEHQAIFQPHNMTLFGGGSLPPEEVKRLLDKEFAGWQPSGAPAKNQPTPEPANKAFRVLIVDRPGSVQTVIRFVFPGVAYSSPNRLGLDALGTVLGGTFTSRLMANLREDKGYTYGASARAVFDPGVGYLLAASPVRADVTGASLSEFLKEFEKLRGGDVQDVEALKARLSIRTGTISSMESLGGLIGTAESLYLRGRTMADLSRDLASMGTLNAAAINPLARAALNLDKAVVILVGDKEQILKQLEGQKLPKPEVVPGLGG
jgi:zinc protease